MFNKLFLVSAAMAIALPAIASSGRTGGTIYHGNVVTAEHMSRIKQTKERVKTVMRNDEQVKTAVSAQVTVFQQMYNPEIVTRFSTYSEFFPRLALAYRPWFQFNFYGGFNYALNPVYAIHDSFFTPLVFWLYSDTWDDHYYKTWYGGDYDSTPALQVHFSRPGVFYPTVAIKDLAFGINSMASKEQGNFRSGMNDLVDRLQHNLADGQTQTIVLIRNDIVVTHYQMLAEAVVLYGFVGTADHQFAFESLLNLNDSSLNAFYVPTGQVTDVEPEDLRLFNAGIIQLGGTITDVPGGRRGD